MHIYIYAGSPNETNKTCQILISLTTVCYVRKKTVGNNNQQRFRIKNRWQPRISTTVFQGKTVVTFSPNNSYIRTVVKYRHLQRFVLKNRWQKYII